MNQIICADAALGLRRLRDGVIPFTLTSCPYDGIREYGGHAWTFGTFARIATELYRVTAPGGVVVWVVQDQVIDGGESGTSFRQALFFQSLGFRLSQTIILEKSGTRSTTQGRYDIPPEFAFVFSKGRPKVFRPIRDRPNRYAGVRAYYVNRERDGTLVRRLGNVVLPFGKRRFVWRYVVNSMTTTKDRYAYGHPALMAEAIAEDLILSWSRPGAVVLDPMCGAGTTLKMALLNHRYYLGFEVHGAYCAVAERRMRDAHRLHQAKLSELFRPLPR